MPMFVNFGKHGKHNYFYETFFGVFASRDTLRLRFNFESSATSMQAIKIFTPNEKSIKLLRPPDWSMIKTAHSVLRGETELLNELLRQRIAGNELYPAHFLPNEYKDSYSTLLSTIPCYREYS